MNVILLTPIIFILAPVASVTFPSRPCQGRSEIDKYNEFIKKHILPPNFDTNSPEEWGKYLMRLGLCGRVPVQSFINNDNKGKVVEICSDAGRLLRDNLCISKSTMLVYHVTSTQGCEVEASDITKRNQNVIVACNMIENQCLPVHYQKYNNERPGNIACT